MKILHNIPLKLLALFFAILLWIHVATNQRYDLEVQYRLAYVNIPDSLVFAQTPTSTIDVFMRGSGKGLIRLLWSERHWPIDMTRAKVGVHRIHLTTDDIPVYGIQGLEALGLLDSDTVTIVLDSVGHRTVPTRSGGDVHAADGFVLSRAPVLTPDSVHLSGARSTLARIDAIYTEPFTVSNLTEPVEKVAALALPSEVALDAPARRCQLYLNVEPYLTREFTSIPVTINPARGGDTLEVWPNRVIVSIAGPQSAVTQLPADSIHVDCAPPPIRGNRTMASVRAKVPTPLQVLKVNPDSVTVERHGRARADTGG